MDASGQEPLGGIVLTPLFTFIHSLVVRSLIRVACFLLLRHSLSPSCSTLRLLVPHANTDEEKGINLDKRPTTVSVAVQLATLKTKMMFAVGEEVGAGLTLRQE